MRRFWKWLQRQDWRVIGLLAALAFAAAVTVALPFLGYSIEPNTKFGAFYASWLAGVLLFVTIGFFAAVASLARPHEDWFGARARNLFRRASGERIDYIIDRLRELEHYSEKTVVKVTIREFDESNGEKKYLVEDFDSVVIKSFIDDIDTTAEEPYDLEGITLPPPNHKVTNCLVYVKINNGPGGAPTAFADAIKRSYTVPIKRGSFGVVETLACVWHKADDEPNEHVPSRFTELLTVDVENRLLSHQPAKVRLLVQGKEAEEFEIESGVTRRVLEAHDLRPRVAAYDLRFLAP